MRGFNLAMMGMFGVLSSGAWAQTTISDGWSLDTSNPNSLTMSTEAVIDQEHFDPAPFPTIDVALQKNGPVVYAPLQAPGHGGFIATDEGLLHTPSGMRCSSTHKLLDSQTNEIVEEVILFRVALYNEDGSDVSCAYINQQQNFLATAFASYWPDTTTEDHFNASADIILTRETPFGEAINTPVVPSTPSAASELEEPTIAGGYDGLPSPEGTIKREGLWLNKTRGWHIKLRSTHTPPRQTPLILSAFMHRSMLDDVATAEGVISNKLVHHDADTGNDMAVTVSLPQE